MLALDTQISKNFEQCGKGLRAIVRGAVKAFVARVVQHSNFLQRIWRTAGGRTQLRIVHRAWDDSFTALGGVPERRGRCRTSCGLSAERIQCINLALIAFRLATIELDCPGKQDEGSRGQNISDG